MLPAFERLALAVPLLRFIPPAWDPDPPPCDRLVPVEVDEERCPIPELLLPADELDERDALGGGAWCCGWCGGGALWCGGGGAAGLFCFF